MLYRNITDGSRIDLQLVSDLPAGTKLRLSTSRENGVFKIWFDIPDSVRVVQRTKSELNALKREEKIDPKTPVD